METVNVRRSAAGAAEWGGGGGSTVGEKGRFGVQDRPEESWYL